MKKYTLTMALAAVLPIVSAGAYEYTNTSTETESYTTVRPVKASAYKKTTTNRKTGGYSNVITNNFYYAEPQGDAFDGDAKLKNKPKDFDKFDKYAYYEDDEDDDAFFGKRHTKKTQENYSYKERKYFLAHPFFQPLKGKVGSVTDIAYAQNNFKFDMSGATVYDASVWPYAPLGSVGMPSGKQKTSQFLVKEDLSIGLSDSVALILMAQYDKTKVSFKDWSDGSPNDKMSDSGLNVFGLGVQSRFVDTNEWIAMVTGSFLHQKDTANSFMADLKVGYKIDRTTLYGLFRPRYTNITSGDSYGAFFQNGSGDYLMLAYDTDVKDIFEIETGVGMFSVLSKYVTLGGELIYGYYDWHNQLNLNASISVQPEDMFALKLYAGTSLYDSAKSKTKPYMQYDATNVLYATGDYKFKDYNEWTIGMQAILYF